MRKLRINPMVVDDLKGIRDYIAEDNPDAAAKVINELYKQFELLREFAGLGQNLTKRVGFKTDYKYMSHGKYIILYKYDESYTEIYRVISSYQDMTKSIFRRDF